MLGKPLWVVADGTAGLWGERGAFHLSLWTFTMTEAWVGDHSPKNLKTGRTEMIRKG